MEEGHLSRIFGVGFRPPHYRWVIENRPRVDFFEVISENFLAVGGRPRRFLEELREHYPVSLHGVSLSIASPEPVRRDYLGSLRELARWLEPRDVSDHLCWTRFGAHQSHDLLPLPLTRGVLDRVISKVHEVQDFLGRRLLLENPSAYVAFAGNTLSEADFLRELCRATGCGVLLDLNNLVVNRHNLGWDPQAYFAALGPDDVAQFHLGGHSVSGEARIDTHDHPVSEEAWALYRQAVARWPRAATLIEWDAKIPEFAVLQAECDRARVEAGRIGEAAFTSRSASAAVTRREGGSEQPARAEACGERQRQLFALIVRPESLAQGEATPELGALSAAVPVPRLEGAGIYHSGYFLRIRDCMRDAFPALAYVCDEEGFSDLVADYLAAHTPEQDSIKFAGARLPEFLRSAGAAELDFGVPPEVLADLAELEWAGAYVFDSPDDERPALSAAALASGGIDWESARLDCHRERVRVVLAGHDVAGVCDAVAHGEPPEKPAKGAVAYLVYRDGVNVERERREPRFGVVLRALLEGEPLAAAAEAGMAGGATAEEAAKLVAGALGLLLEKGWLRGFVGKVDASPDEKYGTTFSSPLADPISIPARDLDHQVARPVGDALASQP